VALVKGATPEMVAAAWLHDTVEDTGVTLETLNEMFGPVVAGYVKDLTSISKADPELAKQLRWVRKAADTEQLKTVPDEVKTIKLADILDNIPDIVAHDKKHAKVFVPEKEAMMPHLVKGDTWLHVRVTAALASAKEFLGIAEA